MPSISSKISGDDLYGEDLTGVTHERVEFVDVDLTESTSASGLVLRDCVFRQVRFNVSTHTGAAFLNCLFSGCSFFDATFTECKFVGSTFEGCTYDQMKVIGGDLSFVALPGADLRKVSFAGAHARGRPDRGAL
ncbi:MAG TPA: pentapeptide repeat-containing protein, partial [Micromonosporaceae bacterium]